MSFRAFPRAHLQAWCEDAVLSNLQYSRVRRSLWDRLVALAKSKIDNVIDLYHMDLAIFNSLKSCLTSRQDGLNDDKLLAFERSVGDVLGELIYEHYGSPVTKEAEEHGASVEIPGYVVGRGLPTTPLAKELKPVFAPAKGTGAVGKQETGIP